MEPCVPAIGHHKHKQGHNALRYHVEDGAKHIKHDDTFSIPWVLNVVEQVAQNSKCVETHCNDAVHVRRVFSFMKFRMLWKVYAVEIKKHDETEHQQTVGTYVSLLFVTEMVIVCSHFSWNYNFTIFVVSYYFLNLFITVHYSHKVHLRVEPVSLSFRHPGDHFWTVQRYSGSIYFES